MPFESNFRAKDQHRWLPQSALLKPSSILPSDIAIDYPQKIVTMGKEGAVGCASNRWKRLLIHPGHLVGRYYLLRNSLGDSRRLALPHHLWNLVRWAKLPAAQRVRERILWEIC